MKAEIKADGHLLISPETELECYALKKWCEENDAGNGEFMPHALMISSIISDDMKRTEQ